MFVKFAVIGLGDTWTPYELKADWIERHANNDTAAAAANECFFRLGFC